MLKIAKETGASYPMNQQTISKPYATFKEVSQQALHAQAPK
jgi:hypothetical protein